MPEPLFPSAFVLRMQQQLKHEWQNFAAAHQLPCPTSIRINPKKDVIKGFEKVPWTDHGYYLPARPSFTFDPHFHAGAFYVQEPSSMFLEQVLKQTVDLSRSLRVLDLCAAPGGKSTHLLSLISNSSLLVTNETIKSRATILAENICKWGNLNAIVTHNDPQDFGSLSGYFDIIIVDAPCSGEGLFRKDAEASSEWSEANRQLCSLRQQRILNQIWTSLKQNGILVYCTCTYNPDENEHNLFPLIKSGRAKSLKLKIENAWGVEEIAREGLFGYQFYPHRVKGEGFFISALQKSEDEEEVNIRSKKMFRPISKKTSEQLSSWIKASTEAEFISLDNLVIALPRQRLEEIEFLSKNLHVIQKGTAVATVKHDKLIPEHAWALSNEMNRNQFTSLELNYEQAIAYLRKDTLNLSSDQRGFTLFKYQGIPIGWANLLGNRVNNLYPAHWRIRASSE